MYIKIPKGHGENSMDLFFEIFHSFDWPLLSKIFTHLKIVPKVIIALYFNAQLCLTPNNILQVDKGIANIRVIGEYNQDN